MDTSIAPLGSILAIAGLEHAPEEEQKKIIDEFVAIAMERVATRIRAGLSNDLKKGFDELFNAPSPVEKRDAFLEQHVPNFAEMLFEEVLALKKKAGEYFANIR